MKKRILRAAVLALAAACFLRVSAAAAPTVSAGSAILVDADSGTVLYEKSPDARSLIASTTKIMTGLLICEQCDPDAAVKIPPQAVGIEGSSMYLKSGETLTVRELLYGMLLQSGNDAAVALALHCSGSVEAFAKEMNEKAQALGLTGTCFANPNGLDSEQNYGTARDLATLTCYALQNGDFAQIVATKSKVIGERCLTNHNKLLWRYEGAIGVKTGYTKSAGRILVSAARRDGRTLVAVTMNAPDDWNDHTKLLDYGFSSFELRQLATQAEPLLTVPTACAGQPKIPLLAAKSLSYPCLPQERVSFHYAGQALLLPPLYQGHPAGTVTIFLDERPVGSVPVVWGATILD